MMVRSLIMIALPILMAAACESPRPSSTTSFSETQEAPMQPIVQSQTDPAHVPEMCNVVVSFTSVCCGVNQPLQARINDLVASDGRVASVSSHPWGPEGEIDLCIRTRSAVDAAGLTRDIEAVIASDERAPPVTVRQGEKPQAGYSPPADLSVEKRVPGT
jgi:hypothetical protein